MTTLASRPRSRKQAWPTKLISINSSCRPAGGGHVSLQVLAGRVQTGGSHPLGGRDPDQVEQVGHGLAGSLAEEQPGPGPLAVVHHHPPRPIPVAGGGEAADPPRPAPAAGG